MKNYILDESGNPKPCEDIAEWARWFCDSDEQRIVAKSHIGESKVSTVFLGLDHQWGDGPPLIYETMVFGGDLDGEQNRYSTREEAESGHKDMVAKVSDGAQ